MATTGSGTGSPITTGPSGANDVFYSWPSGVVTLARYARIIGYNEPAFWGVVHPDNARYACREIWTKDQRDSVARYLSEAQDDIEGVINYFLQPTWVIDDRPPTTTGVMLAKYGKLLVAGQRAESTILAGAPISHVADPAVIGPILTTVTDTAEIKVFYPGTTQEIQPDKVAISGGYVTIWIPRVRMVHPDVMDNPSTGLDYGNLDNFLEVVDVKRVYNDATTTAEFAWETNTITGTTTQNTTAVLSIRNAEIGEVFANPTQNPTLGSGKTSLVRARLFYRAGLESLPQKAEDAIVRLAHAKMPEEPCGCEGVRRVWKRDNHIPEILSRERLNCPFGLNNGAWVAYNFALSMAMPRMGMWR